MSTVQDRLKEREMATGSAAPQGGALPETVRNPVPTKSGRLRIDGAEVYYEIHGDGEPLLLIHGLGSCGADWAPSSSTRAPAAWAWAVTARMSCMAPVR